MNEIIVCHLPLTVGCVVHMNAFLLYDGSTREAMIIDPGGEPDRIYDELLEKQLKLKYIAITHGHFDHIMGVSRLANRTGAHICMSPGDEFFIHDSRLNAVYVRNLPPVDAFHVDFYLRDGDVLKLGENSVKVIETPGHTPGHLSYFIGNHLFSGDTILKGTTGRMDLLGADVPLITKVIEEKIFPLPDSTLIYCGHGEFSTVGYEKLHNDTARILI